ncbi:uncharacterized protein TNCT_384321 [Trichonephila clavata]|uniref:Uncharacterized protein n=1 Tax=Trichonephila clavata TaxID=2740835 RepID=A0A8X6HUV2_TRICU|nr:uncharacterized protein TNCT_384321 [Trichonephila clavata]
MLQKLPFEAQEYHFDRDEEKVKTLGLILNPKHDNFEFSVSDPTNNSEWTKRTILTHIARIFDPMGLLGPVIFKAKLFMKTLWLVKRDWDQPLLETQIQNWKKFVFSLKALQGIKVQRFVLIENYKYLELHGFSDASEKAFGAAIYLRCTNSSEQSSMRFSRNAKNLHSKRMGPLTSEELTDAKQCLVRMIQVREFLDDFIKGSNGK